MNGNKFTRPTEWNRMLAFRTTQIVGKRKGREKV
jgi:hypothetical protein